MNTVKKSTNKIKTNFLILKLLIFLPFYQTTLHIKTYLSKLRHKKPHLQRFYIILQNLYISH